MLPNLKNDGLSLQACHIFEDEVDDFHILVPVQKTGSVLLKVVHEVVQDEVGPCNTQEALTYYHKLSLDVYISGTTSSLRDLRFSRL
jgi:hypothetical protein